MDRLYYVVGFFDGVLLGCDFSWLKYSQGTDQEKACVNQAVTSCKYFSYKYVHNVTSTQLRDGLDTFYFDYRNRGIMVRDAAWLALNAIAGTPQGKLNEMIEFYRRQPRY